jgi:hypothetical protein
MEALLGFLVGFWVGTKQGRQGMLKLIESADAIRRSPETRRLIAQGISTGVSAVSPAVQTLSRSAGGSIGGVVTELARARGGRNGRG